VSSRDPPEQRFHLGVDKRFLTSPRFTCVDVKEGRTLTIERVGGPKWYQHDFLASEDGDLQIDIGMNVYFATSITQSLAIGLQLLLDSRF
jgi:hypothetical protein